MYKVYTKDPYMYKLKTSIQLANETIIDREGVFYLEQVTVLVCNDRHGLGLKDYPVNVTYKTFFNSRHPNYRNE